jgi:hypothetical protein
MKSILLSASIFISASLFGQLKTPVESEIESINLRLDKFRTEHNKGVIACFVGAGILAASIFVPDQGVNEATGSLRLPVVIVGSSVSLFGIIRTLQSYRHLKSPTNKAVRAYLPNNSGSMNAYYSSK